MNSKKYSLEKNTEKSASLLGVRHFIVVLLSCISATLYGTNANFSVAIVAMTNVNDNTDIPTYNWTDSNIIISSYYWIALPCQLVSSQLAEKYGSKWLLAFTGVLLSIFTAIIPVMAAIGSWGVMLCRIVQGSSNALFFPAAFNVISKWAPVPERTRLCNLLFTGTMVGTIISMSLTGIICDSRFGWPLVFYISGSIALLFSVIWISFGASSPQEHKLLSETEKDYILSTQGKHAPVKPESTPWLKIAKSLPVWAIGIGSCSFNWGFFMLISELPSYLNGVFGFDLSSNGLLSALPYIAFIILNNLFAVLFDFMINKKFLSITNARKIATTIGVIVPAVTLTLLGILGKHASTTSIIILLVLSVGLNSGITSGFLINHTDIAPNYSATINALTNAPSTIFSILGPVVVQLTVTDLGDVNQWAIIFYITAAFYAVSGVFYIVFGSGEVQPWNSEGFKNSQPPS